LGSQAARNRAAEFDPSSCRAGRSLKISPHIEPCIAHTLNRMKCSKPVCFLLALAMLCSSARAGGAPLKAGDPSRYDVIWNSPSKSAIDSMPIGNGDIGLNLWIDPRGDLVFYVAKTDAISENGEFLKLGKVRVKFDPPLETTHSLAQHLHLIDGVILISDAPSGIPRTTRVWVDANHPEIHVDAHSTGRANGMRASLELWRTQQRTLDLSKDRGMGDESFGLRELRGGPPAVFEPDHAVMTQDSHLIWWHRDEKSIYPEVLAAEHLNSLLDKYPDPILHRTFGCLMRGPGFKSDGDQSLQSPVQPDQHLIITCLTQQTPALAEWTENIEKLARADDAIAPSQAWAAHVHWWHDFWDRSWIDIASSGGDGEKVASGYALQRWMMACNARGSLPVKYNGGLFTVGKSFPDPLNKANKVDDPDWRAWGSNYWFQNTRHLYWPLIPSGDDDLLQPWFDMYVHDLPLVEDKTWQYWHHRGAAFQETMYFFGLPGVSDFGWNNKTNELQNTWIRWYWSGGIEMTAMMLARYQYTDDDQFARQTLLPFADAITLFYDEHWKRDANGKIRFEPAQSLETWQHGVVNPLPEIAGLKYVLPQLLSLPASLTSQQQRTRWSTMLADLPPVPIGPGKDGQPVLLPAEKFQKPGNVENTELYAVYPYRLFGVGLPDQELARRTFAQRRFKGPKCWSQDPIDAALLGLTDEARRDVIANFTNSGARFQAFWKPEHDWIPDFDNGGAGMQTLQWMLMQCDGKRILLLPAWPPDWDADLKLRAPMQTTIIAQVRHAKLVHLEVSPPQRRADVILPGGPGDAN
jgi:alpha-L-fucosidase 2